MLESFEYHENPFYVGGATSTLADVFVLDPYSPLVDCSLTLKPLKQWYELKSSDTYRKCLYDNFLTSVMNACLVICLIEVYPSCVFCMYVFYVTRTIDASDEGQDQGGTAAGYPEEDQGQPSTQGKPPSCSCPLTYWFSTYMFYLFFWKCMTLKNVYLWRAWHPQAGQTITH